MEMELDHSEEEEEYKVDGCCEQRPIKMVGAVAEWVRSLAWSGDRTVHDWVRTPLR